MQDSNSVLNEVTNGEYKYGFVTDIDTDVIHRGLDEETVRIISAKKHEPEWLLEFRLRAFRYWQTLEMPDWALLKIPPIDYQDIIYYAAPVKKDGPKSMEEVDPELASALTTLFDGEDVVPFMYSTWTLNPWDSNEYQVLFDSGTYTSSEPRDELMDAYVEVLIAAGFTSTEEGVYTQGNVEITFSTDDYFAPYYGYYFTVTVTNLDKAPEPVDVTSALTTWAAIDETYGTNIVEALEAIFGEGNADTIPALDVGSEWFDNTANQSYYDFIAFCTLPAGTQWDSEEVYSALSELIDAKLTEAGFTTTDGYEYVKGNITVYFDTWSQISFMVKVSDSTAE